MTQSSFDSKTSPSKLRSISTSSLAAIISASMESKIRSTFKHTARRAELLSPLFVVIISTLMLTQMAVSLAQSSTQDAPELSPIKDKLMGTVVTGLPETKSTSAVTTSDQAVKLLSDGLVESAGGSRASPSAKPRVENIIDKHTADVNKVDLLSETDLRATGATNNHEQDDMTANSTLLIDYDHQGYNLPLSTDKMTTSGPASSASPDQTLTSSLASSEAEILVDVERKELTDDEQKASDLELQRSSRSSSIDDVVSSTPTFSTVAKQDDGDLKQPAPKGSPHEQIADKSARLANLRDSRDARLALDKETINATNIYKVLFKKKPYSKYWTVEQKWDDIFKRFLSIEGSVRHLLMKSLLRDIEQYTDIGISAACADDLKFVQEYAKNSTNFRWLMHMVDATGKTEPGMLTGNLANLGHVIQCIKARAPAKSSNHTFEDRFFDQQTELLGERFRGKYCLASVRPVLPEKPRLVSRFSEILDESLLSNISYMGEPIEMLRRRASDSSTPSDAHDLIDRKHLRLDQVPFESELYQYLIAQRNFMFSLPKFMGVCYPSSCTKEDIRASIQKSLDDQHQVVDIEYQCEQEELSAWDWFSTPRLVAFVFVLLILTITFVASLARYILVDKLGMKKRLAGKDGALTNLIATLDVMSMDKCAGILFVKTKRASPIVDANKSENNRSTSIDALKGFLMLVIIYSELVYLGCLPVPFMWSKWADAMFPFYRSFVTQFFLNISIWGESFYIISAFLISFKFFQNHRSFPNHQGAPQRKPDMASFILSRYVRLTIPVIAFIALNYVWPRLSNGFVMQDQANKLLSPCDNYGWTNVLLFHNHNALNETCLWPSHVSATFFQLHLISYPILVLLLASINSRIDIDQPARKLIPHIKLSAHAGMIALVVLTVIGIFYPAKVATDQNLIVPFLIDYIDFDNYKRVIEWTVLPTYNHLASYMIGIAIAYLVARREMSQMLNLPSSSRAIINHGESIESFKTISSTKAFESATDALDSNSKNLSKPDKMACSSFANWILSSLANLFALLLVLISTTASWYWNGLGQPMSPIQTFWYMCTTKLVFGLAFAYLFYKHFATRRNSINPWMITRFLVPIGRVSLTLFYMSWLVIWFDLLSSLYQWHPSHYFIFEKFSEIIFIVLVLSLFVYGAFEGTSKIAQYRQTSQQDQSISGTSLPLPNVDRQHQILSHNSNKSGSNLSAFDRVYMALADDRDNLDESVERSNREASGGKELGGNKLIGKSSSLLDANFQRSVPCQPGKSGRVSESRLLTTTDALTSEDARNLSISDQYKLNAELRANYSFASIGLYESAGATGDFRQSNDPQVSN